MLLSHDASHEQTPSSHPEISIVLPTYNRRRRLERCLPSFLKTSVEKAEFIILDNCSTDDTWHYLQEVKKKDNRLRLIRHPQNIGGAKSTFRGYCEARAPYVLWLADDDLMIGDYIASCLEIFKKYPEVGVVHHFFDGWQSSPDRYENPIKIYSSGNEAVKRIFMLSGSYPGLALRMRDFSLRNFPICDNVIYPQVKISIEITSKKSLAIINDCGMVGEDFGDSIIDYKLFQSRPDDMGIGERLSYASLRGDPLLTQILALQLSGWATGLLKEFKNHDENATMLFVKALTRNLNSVSPAFIIFLLKNKEIKYFLVSIFNLLRTPIFIKNYIYFLILIFKRSAKKLTKVN